MPDIITYSALIGTCEKGKHPDQAVEIFKELQRRVVVPDMISHNALISACEKGEQPD